MLISTEIASAARLVGEEKAIEFYAKAGFDAWDFPTHLMLPFDWDTMKFTKTNHPLAGKDYLKHARRLKKIGEDNGIHCNQSHAPAPSSLGICDHLKRAIECTAEVGAEICVFHPDIYTDVAGNTELFSALLPFAKEHGVKIAIENLFAWEKGSPDASPTACSTPESFDAHLNAINDPDFVACLDVGHAEMLKDATSATRLIYTLGNRLQALHIHDNDRHGDKHQIPFSMQIDFDAIVKALKDIGYTGYLTLEADRYLADFTPETAFEGCKNLAASARKLAGMF
ncbi:MAG: sugar phosphate isomerase/epimerase [Clostridia bacterium]|nr:sugar phosphate isomerase/epimerase [Clostridia bacterium]